MPTSVSPNGTAVQEFRLRIHPQQPDHDWQAELRDLGAPPDALPMTFDTPLDLARYLARDLARNPASRPKAPGLR